MKNGLAILLFGLLVVAVQTGARLWSGDLTWGSLERRWSDPDISDRPIGYEPPDLLALQRQLLDGRYAELDAHFAGLQRDYLSGARPELEYILSYKAFQTTNPEIGGALDRWVATRPDSAAALTARATYLMHRAWWMGDYVQPAKGPMEKGADWKRDVQTYAGARRDLERAVALDRRNTVALADLIWVVHDFGDDALAPAFRERGLAVDPLSFAVHHSWVMGLLDGPDGIQAAQDYVDSIRPEFARKPLLKRLDAQILEHRARKLAEQDQIHKAIDLLFEADADAEGAYFLHYRASLLRRIGAEDWAEADLDRAYRYLPQLARTLARRADLYDATERADLAARDFALALELDPLNPNILWDRSGMYYRAERFAEAEADLTTAMRLRPDGAALRFRRGRLRLKKLDDTAGAADDFAVAVAGYPDSPEVWRLYTRTLTDIDDCRAVEALAGFRRACAVAGSSRCRGSLLEGETRRVEKMAERMACAPSG